VKRTEHIATRDRRFRFSGLSFSSRKVRSRLFGINFCDSIKTCFKFQPVKLSIANLLSQAAYGLDVQISHYFEARVI